MNNDQTIESRHRRGNVARLPKILRDKVNSMLDDGAPYAQIVEALASSTNPPLPHSVNEDNIANWKKGGYQDYLKAQDWRERITINADRFLEVGAEDPTRLMAGGLYAAIVQICEIMDQLSQPTNGETDADKCTRVSHALSRLSNAMLTIQQYRDQVAKEKAAELPKRDPNRPFGDESDHRAVVDIIDRVLGLGNHSKPSTSKPSGWMLIDGKSVPIGGPYESPDAQASAPVPNENSNTQGTGAVITE
jgi:hypothetical protein